MTALIQYGSQSYGPHYKPVSLFRPILIYHMSEMLINVLP
jgi:hypothetical protein